MTHMLAIVIPIFNEEENILPLVEEIEAAICPLNISWELIFVNDGSTDKSKMILEDLAGQKNNIKVIHFKKNAGQTAAFDAGFAQANSTYVATLDGDRQNNPSDIPALLKMAQTDGWDLVAGKRRKREDSEVKKIISRFGNYFRQKALQDGISDTGCSLKIFKLTSLRKIKLYKGMHRFLPALFLIEGFRVKEALVDHRPRYRGTSKYNFFSRGFALVWDLVAVCWMKKRKLTYEVERITNP